MRDNRPFPNKPSRIAVVLTILAVALAGPVLGLAMWAFGFAFAPPWTSLTGMVYPLLGCVWLPLGIIAIWAGRLRIWGMLAAMVVAGMAALLLLTMVGPSLPTGMTNCRLLESPPPQVRYACVSTSSDNPAYRYEFTLEGRANWPVMRLVYQNPSP